MNIDYATEEAVEDAFVEYLTSVLPGEVKVFAAMTREEAVYPSVVVTVQSNDSVNESAGWNTHRVMEVEIKLGVEAKDEVEGGQVVKALRERHRELRDALMAALTGTDLVNRLNATGKARFSLVVFGPIRRATDGRILETLIPLAITA